MTDLTPEEVARLAAAATPGPWFVHGCTATEVGSCRGIYQSYYPICVAVGNSHFNAAAHDMVALIAKQAARIAELEQRAEPVAWLGPYQTAAEALDELRKSCALIIEADPETWPSNGNAPLAITAVLALWRHQAMNATPPAPSVPEGWLRTIDEEMVSAHLGVASPDDSYEDAKKKLNALICWHVAVATDPTVNGGWKLVPIEPTLEMIKANGTSGTPEGDEWLADDARKTWAAMLAAAPEVKP